MERQHSLSRILKSFLEASWLWDEWINFGLVGGLHWVCENVLCFLLLGTLVPRLQREAKRCCLNQYALQKMWMISRQVRLGLWHDQVEAQCAEGRTSFNLCSIKAFLLSQPLMFSVVFCFLSFRVQEDTVQRLKMDFWVLHRKKSSAIVKPRFMKCYRRKEDGVEWVWINQLFFLWGSKTSERKQMLTLWMWLKKTGKEIRAVQYKIV